MRQNLFRYDNQAWQQTAMDTVTAGENTWLAYAYGEDIAVQVWNNLSDAVTTASNYDPTTGTYNNFFHHHVSPDGIGREPARLAFYLRRLLGRPEFSVLPWSQRLAGVGRLCGRAGASPT